MKDFDWKWKLQCEWVSEYSVSLFDPPLSLRSHWNPSSTARPCHDHFVKENGVPSNSTEETSEQIQNFDISPHLFGKGFDLMKKMGYKGDGPLGKGKGIVKPLIV